jgi:hypothetical protein
MDNKQKILLRIQELDEMLMLNERRLIYKNDDLKQQLIDLCEEFKKERDHLEIQYNKLI